MSATPVSDTHHRIMIDAISGFLHQVYDVEGIIRWGGMLMLVPSATLVSGLLLASAMVGALLVHIFVIGIGVQTVVVFALLCAITAVMWHRRDNR